jgi:hypothetical protein
MNAVHGMSANRSRRRDRNKVFVQRRPQLGIGSSWPTRPSVVLIGMVSTPPALNTGIAFKNYYQ